MYDLQLAGAGTSDSNVGFGRGRRRQSVQPHCALQDFCRRDFEDCASGRDQRARSGWLWRGYHTKSITISSECFEAGVLVSGTNGIVVSAGNGDKIKLRGLDINGLTTGLSAIKFLSGGQL